MTLQPKDIVLVHQGHDWEGCLVVVEEIKIFGIVGYTQIPSGGQAYVRLRQGEFSKVGRLIEEGGEEIG